MEYAKLQLVHTRSRTWRRACAAARSAAISVLAYIADQETDGRLPGAATWQDEDWRETIAVSLSEVDEAVESGLCSWDGQDLVCSLWDGHGAAKLAVQRGQGHHGSQGGRPPKTVAHSTRGNKDRNPKGFVPDNPKGFDGETDQETLPETLAEKDDNPQTSPSRPDQTSPPTPPSPDALPGEPDDPALLVVEALGGFLDHPTTGKDLRPEWRQVIAGLAPQHIEQVFEAGPTISAEGTIRYPDRFRRVREALRDRIADESRRRQAASEAQAKREQAAAAEQDHARLEAAAQEPAQRVIDYVRSLEIPERDHLLEELAKDPAAAGPIGSILTKGRLTALGLVILRRHPVLGAIADGKPAEVA